MAIRLIGRTRELNECVVRLCQRIPTSREYIHVKQALLDASLKLERFLPAIYTADGISRRILSLSKLHDTLETILLLLNIIQDRKILCPTYVQPFRQECAEVHASAAHHIKILRKERKTMGAKPVDDVRSGQLQ